MNILGIETSTRAASVAVISEDKLLAEVIQESRSPHSETLQVQIIVLHDIMWKQWRISNYQIL